MLTILLATCEVTLETARTKEIALDRELVADLERVVERLRAELGASAEPSLERSSRPRRDV